MKTVVYIGNRPNLIEKIQHHPSYRLIKAFVPDSLMDKNASLLNADLYEDIDFKKIDDFLLNEKFDICISGGCPHILPVEKYCKSKLFINSHPSVLPIGRGKHPLNEVFLNNRDSAGSTVHLLTRELDEGDIIAQRSFQITEELDISLIYSFIFEFEADVFVDALNILDNGQELECMPQRGLNSYYSRRSNDLNLQPKNLTGEEFIARVKAFNSPSLGARLEYKKSGIKIYQAEIIRNTTLLKYAPKLSMGEVGALKNTRYLIVRVTDSIVLIRNWAMITDDK